MEPVGVVEAYTTKTSLCYGQFKKARWLLKKKFSEL